MARGYTLTQTGSEVQEILNDEPTKQDGLVSGENIKTINNQSILGPGNISVITSETDPTVPNWAKQPNKPSYTASEVGAVPTTRTVNGKALSSNISLTASDVNALPSSTSIPDELSDLSDDSTHRLVTDTEKATWNGKYTKPQTGIPASDLASGVIPDVSQFITKTVDDLTNYYTKTQTYTQSEVNSLIAGISSFEYEVVATLPTASASTMHKIYLVPSSDPQTQNIKDEYITIESSSSYSWEQIGSTAIDLSGYVTTTDLNTALANYQPLIDSTHKLDYSLLDNTPTIPAAGIPAGGNAGQVLTKTDGSTDYAVAWRDTLHIYPSAYCTTSASTAIKGAACTFWTATANSYLYILITNANTNQGALSLNVNSTGAKPIYINGTASSSSNYTLPAGSYIVFYDGTNYYFRTDGKLTASITGETDPIFTASPAYGITSSDITKWDAAAVVADDDGSATTPDFDAEADTVWHKAQTLSSAQKSQARTNIGAQETLVSGANIKTINNESILGSGNITIQGGGGGGEANVIESISINGTTQTVTSKNVDLPVPTSADVYSIVKLTQAAYDALATKVATTLYIITS